MGLLKLRIGIVIWLMVACFYADTSATVEKVSKFLKEVKEHLGELTDEVNLAEMEKEKIGSNDRSKINIAQKKLNDYMFSIAKDVTKYKELAKGNSALERELRHIPLTYEVLTQEEYELITNLAMNATQLYNTIKLCSYEDKNDCSLGFLTDVAVVLLQLEDIKQVEYYWMQWVDKIAAEMKDMYSKFLELYRKAAKLSGFSNVSDFWYRELAEKGSTVTQNLEKFFKQTQPLYKQVHAYLRSQMRSKYGAELIEYNKPVPDYLWMPTVSSISLAKDNPDVLPFKTLPLPNITDILLKQQLTPKTIFEKAHKFYTSLGMPALENSFWEDNCIQKKDLSEYEVAPAVWTFHNPHSIKVTYSPLVNEITFYSIYGVLSDIHYRRAFAKQNILYQKPAILEVDSALAGFFRLAASSPKYLESIGIKYSDYASKEARINRLYLEGIENTNSLYFNYLSERIRVGFLAKSQDINDNCATVNLVESVYGTQPPIARSKSDFDAARNLVVQYDALTASKMYTVVLKYQLFEHFCSLTGEYKKNDPTKPLDLCNLSGHPEVGEQIYKAMSLGASVNDKEFLKVLLNTESLDISGFLEYFKPLLQWLEEHNKQNKNEVGWESAKKCH